MAKIAKKNKVGVKKVKVKNVIDAKVKKDVLPLPTITTNDKQELSINLLKPRAVTTGVYALLEIIKRRGDEGKKKTLFKDDPKDIMLQIVPIKIPVTEMQQIRVVLPHPLTVEGSDVCLITQNVKKATKNDHEPTIAFYKSLLQEKKIKGITEIVPIRQLRSEHVPFEMKGRFADMYDMFLVDGRLFGKVTKFLGSRFFKKNKDLIPVKINTVNVKQELEKALAKTVLTVHGTGDSYSVKVGYSSFTVEQLETNILAVAEALDKSFPGGFVNIRKLYVKSDRSMAIPIYLSLAPHNSVPVPSVKARLPKAYVDVEGELTTHIGTRVTVKPTGEVIVKKSFTAEDIEMGYTSVGPSKPVNSAPAKYVNEDKVEAPKAKGKKRKAAADSSDDEDVEAAENAYVSELSNTPKQRGQAKAVGTAQSKKEVAAAKRLAAKAKKEERKLQSKSVQQVNNGEVQGSPTDEATGKAGVKRKKSNVTPKVKTQPEPQEEPEMIGVKRKKLNKKSTKVEPSEVVEQVPVLGEIVSLGPKNVKAAPKAQVGKVKKLLKKNAKVGSLNTIQNPTLGKEDGLNTLRDQVVKAKNQAILAKKQLKKDAKMGSPIGITKLTSSKKGASKKQRALGNSADVLGATLEMTGTKGPTLEMTGTKGPTETPDLLNNMVTDQEKKNKVTKKSSRLQSTRLEVMFNMIKQSRIDETKVKDVKNEAESPANSKLNMLDASASVNERGTNKKTKRMKTGENLFLSVQALGSPTLETTADKKKKKRDNLVTNDKFTMSELETSTKKKKKKVGDKLTNATPLVQYLDFGSTPSIEAEYSSKDEKRNAFLNSVLVKPQNFGSPAIKPSAEKKKKLDKRTTNAQMTPTNSVSHSLDFGSPAVKTSAEKKKPGKRTAGAQKTPTSTEKKKKKQSGKRASLGEESSANSTLPLQGLEAPMTEEKVKKKKKRDKLATTIAEGSMNSKLDSLDVEIPTIDRLSDMKGKGKPVTPLKLKKSKRLQDKSALAVLPPKQKKTRQSISQENPLQVKSSKVPATVDSQSPWNSEKSSKSEGKTKDIKPDRKSDAAIVEKKVYVKKSFPRYFSLENQQTLADYGNTAQKKRKPQDNDPTVNIREALPQYIGVAVKSDIQSIIRKAKDNEESVVTMPTELIMELKNNLERKQYIKDKMRKRQEKKTSRRMNNRDKAESYE